MRHTWPALQLSLLPAGDERPRHTTILVESDLPDLVIAERNGSPWLGLACDDDAATRSVRWLYAPLTTVERDALLRGAVAIRDCFDWKGGMLMVEDSPSGATVCPIEPSQIPDAALPDAGFALPEWARPAAEAAPERGAIVSLARMGGGRGINLRSLAAVVDAFQRFVAAITQVVVEKKATVAGVLSVQVQRLAEMELESAAPGSLILRLQPSVESHFAEISRRVQALMRASGDEEIADELAALGPRVLGRYEDMIEEVLQHSLHMLVTWPSGPSVFLGGVTADRVLASLPSPEPGEVSARVVRGLITGLDAGSGTFTIYDLQTDEEIKGKVSDNFRMPPSITLGQDSPVRVVELGRSQHRTRGGASVSRYELQRILLGGASN